MFLRKLRCSRLSYANVVSSLALALAVGGFKVGDNTQDAPNGGTVTLQPNGATQITFTTRATNGTITNLPFHFAVSC